MSNYVSYVGIIRIRFAGRSVQLPLSLSASSPIKLQRSFTKGGSTRIWKFLQGAEKKFCDVVFATVTRAVVGDGESRRESLFELVTRAVCGDIESRRAEVFEHGNGRAARFDGKSVARFVESARDFLTEPDNVTALELVAVDRGTEVATKNPPSVTRRMCDCDSRVFS